MNDAEKQMQFLTQKDKIMIQMTVEEFYVAMQNAVDEGFKRNFDQLAFWEKFPDLMTTNEACEGLNIGRTKLLELVNKGTIKKFGVDKSPRYKKQELFEYVESSNHFSAMRLRKQKQAKRKNIS